MEILSRKYSKDHEDKIQNEIKKGLGNMAMIVIDIEYMSGKEAMELVKKRGNDEL